MARGQRDLWTNSGGLRGATLWPAPESPAPPRVRRQYGKIKRVLQKHGLHELKFLEYSLVDNPDTPLSPELLQRRLFQTLPVDCMAVKPIKPLRAAIDTPARKRTLSERLNSESNAQTTATTTATAGKRPCAPRLAKSSGRRSQSWTPWMQITLSPFWRASMPGCSVMVARCRAVR